MIRRVSRAVLAASLIAVLAMSSACSREKNIVPTGILEGDKYLMDRATELVGKKKWFQAREYYRQLVDNYPQSNYRPDAKLGLGDTYLGEKSSESLVLAENEFREFLTFYPTNARADYAQYKLGMCHFQQMLAPDRDQTATKEAIGELALFVQRYPQSALLDEGRQKLRTAQNRLTESEYKVGYFYWRNKWYPGAIDRFKAVLKNDPDIPDAGCRLLLPRRLAGEDGPARRSHSLFRSPDERVRAERLPGQGPAGAEGTARGAPAAREVAGARRLGRQNGDAARANLR